MGNLPNLATLLTSQGSCWLVHSAARLDFCANQTPVRSHPLRGGLSSSLPLKPMLFTGRQYFWGNEWESTEAEGVGSVEASPLRRGRKILNIVENKKCRLPKLLQWINALKYDYFNIFQYIMFVSPGKGTLAPPIAYWQLLQGGSSSLSLRWLPLISPKVLAAGE